MERGTRTRRERPTSGLSIWVSGIEVIEVSGSIYNNEAMLPFLGHIDAELLHPGSKGRYELRAPRQMRLAL